MNNLGKAIQTYRLKNIPDWIKYCDIVEYENGTVLLNWGSKDCGGEDGFFLSLRRCKTYVTQHITSVKSLWIETNDIEIYNN